MGGMWQPDPAWTALPAGAGSATVGVWRAHRQGVEAVVKRLARPGPEDPALLSEPRHTGYWRREAEVALDEQRVSGPGLVPPHYLSVEEDEDGVTIWAEEIRAEPPTSLLVARSLGRYAASPYDAPQWASRGALADRLALVASRGGWPTLERTTLADVASHLWASRSRWLTTCDEGPQGRLHGDAVRGNFVGCRSGDVVAIDWQAFGTGAIGTDLGYLALAAREDFEILLETFLDGVRESSPDTDPEPVRTAAVVMCVYTVLSRAEWALSRVAPGEGALAGKFNHPAVAPHLRAVQRHAPLVEALLG